MFPSWRALQIKAIILSDTDSLEIPAHPRSIMEKLSGIFLGAITPMHLAPQAIVIAVLCVFRKSALMQ